MLKKVLIANRGEIAVRIIRSCRERGIPTVAVFSEADRTAPHVLLADEAVAIGPPPSAESYLNAEAILAAAERTGADSLHPGYGFLSENADFAEAVSAAGLVWIGPPADVIRQMGDKLAARRIAAQAGATVVPGASEAVSDLAQLKRAAKEAGYPVLIKAAGGGGGKGMRIVHSAAELPAALERARSEAGSAFADDRVYLEKYIESPHHIEVQIFADNHGHVVHLGERECSIQRRYQKVIEETPSPTIDAAMRQELSATAIAITRACAYIGAGTVEFLVDRDRNYYFLEMNTRLQVEHPITEMVTGFDLVAEQLSVAAGEPLTFGQDEVMPRGHAIEARIYAEDGFDGFAPSMGTILELGTPGGPGVRLDNGIRAGQEITPYYDPLLGKLSAWGRSRDEARLRLLRALGELRIVGLNTTIPFCRAVLRHPHFITGDYDTHFVSSAGADLEKIDRNTHDGQTTAAAIGAAMVGENVSRPTDHGQAPSRGDSSWLTAGRQQQLES